ncbi:hypothetical protein LTR66_012742 [Elasticomyces elasticus]|nr:hypothetical protein LTR66_012742 [Elasticomyces elasticus]
MAPNVGTLLSYTGNLGSQAHGSVSTQTVSPAVGPATTVGGTQLSAAPSPSAVVAGSSLSVLVSPAQVTQGQGDPASTVTVGGQTVTESGASVLVLGSQTSGANRPVATVSGASTTLGAYASSSSVAGNGATPTIQQTQVSPPPLLTVAGETLTANAATQYSVAPSQTLTPGGKVTVSGTTLSLAPSASYVVVNGVTQTLSSSAAATPPPIVTIGSTAYAPNVGSSYDVGGQILTPGGVIAISGTTISLASGASEVVVNGVTPSVSTKPPPLTVNGNTYTANPGSSYVIQGQTLTPEGVLTLSGGATISLVSSASALVINGITSTVTKASVTSAPTLTLGGSTYIDSSGSGYVIQGQTLTPGGILTLSAGTVASLATSASNLAIGGTTSSIAVKASSTTSPPVLTIGGTTYAANGQSTYLVQGQTLTPGGNLTLSGGTTIALASHASNLVINGATSTLANNMPTITAPPFLTINGTTYSANGGSTYRIGSQILTPGGSITISGGSLLVISLSPQATILIIMEGPLGAALTTTEIETLYPATLTRTVNADAAAATGSATGTRPAATTGLGAASLQNVAAGVVGRIGASFVLGALLMLALAVLL